jgi:hypothetical protein
VDWGVRDVFGVIGAGNDSNSLPISMVQLRPSPLPQSI